MLIIAREITSRENSIQFQYVRTLQQPIWCQLFLELGLHMTEDSPALLYKDFPRDLAGKGLNKVAYLCSLE